MVCVHCGCSVDDNYVNKTNNEDDTPKTAIGILLAIFLGIIGLIVGLCLFKDGSIARKTFLKSWSITFAISFIFEILILILYLFVFIPAFTNAL